LVIRWNTSLPVLRYGRVEFNNPEKDDEGRYSGSVRVDIANDGPNPAENVYLQVFMLGETPPHVVSDIECLPVSFSEGFAVFRIPSVPAGRTSSVQFTERMAELRERPFAFSKEFLYAPMVVNVYSDRVPVRRDPNLDGSRIKLAADDVRNLAH
jgi:hypothetical protein